ncbi:MAG: hypothetical protein IT384_28835 [Deltaproteobacteria bacterium]|nr:hypothetical protein [Deltaproteobacteria bacterium]
MARALPAPASPRGGRSPSRSTFSASRLVALLDDDPIHYPVEQWRQRNVELYERLAQSGLVDASLVSMEAHRFLTDSLIHAANPAAIDPQNAGHVRAQNENILHYAISLGAPPATLTIALSAGFIHDLNKAVGVRLRRDRYAVREASGAVHPELRTVAESVGLNHLGDLTRAQLEAATRLERGALSREAAEAIDLCIVHHGLGSSRFIQRLIEGRNEWWGDEFVDSETGIRRLIHPANPPLTLESLLHDLADSTQQMQGGTAWLFKYPGGFWRDSRRSYWEMLSAAEPTPGAAIPMSLRQQIDVESETCRRLVREALLDGLISEAAAEALDQAVALARRGTERWIDDRPRTLAKPRAATLYHDIAQSIELSPREVHARLKDLTPEHSRGTKGRIEAAIWASARRLDTQRARELARLLQRAARPGH